MRNIFLKSHAENEVRRLIPDLFLLLKKKQYNTIKTNFKTFQTVDSKIFSILIICCPVCDVINFKINHSFLVKPFFYITKKSEQTVNISETKRAFNMKQKVFFIIFKEPSLRQTKQLLWKLRVRP